MVTPKTFIAGGEPKALTKKKFCHVYNLISSLQLVKVEPVSTYVLAHDVFVTFLGYCTDYCISKSRKATDSHALLRFPSVEDGENALRVLRDALGPDYSVSHPPVDPDLDLSLLQENHIDIYYWARKAAGGLITESESVASRGVVLEGVPAGVDMATLAADFPEAVTLLDFTKDETVQDAVVVELGSSEEAERLVRERHGSDYRGGTLCATPLERRLHTLNISHAVFHKEAEQGISFLSDMARMTKLRTCVHLDAEKQQLLNETSELAGYGKLERYEQILRELEGMRRELVTDTRRRLRDGYALPEKATESDVELSDELQRTVGDLALAPKQRGLRNAEKRAFPAADGQGSGSAEGTAPQPKKGASGDAEPTFKNDQQLMSYLSERVKQLTDAVRAQGKDPSVRVKSSGLGRWSREALPASGNPVIRGLRVRVEELENILEDKPASQPSRQQKAPAHAAGPGGPMGGAGPMGGGGAMGGFGAVGGVAKGGLGAMGGGAASAPATQAPQQPTDPDEITKEVEIQVLSDLVRELTDEVKAQGKDPSAPMRNCKMGKHANRKPIGNPVIVGLRTRMAELIALLNDNEPSKPAAPQVPPPRLLPPTPGQAETVQARKMMNTMMEMITSLQNRQARGEDCSTELNACLENLKNMMKSS